MSRPQKVWLITGVSRGLGKALAEAVLANGDIVIGTTRDGKADLAANGDLHLIALEMTNTNQIVTAVTQAHAFHGRLDVIVNNAGYGHLAAIEETTAEETEKVFAVDFFGPLKIIQTALPLLRAQRSGHIINITSIAGLAPMASSGVYAAAKFAVEGLSQALAQEVAPLGIKVTLVEPGAFRTDFLSDHSVRKSVNGIADYASTAHAIVARLDAMAGKQLGDPVRAAAAIIAAVNAPNPPLNLVLGSDALARTRARQAQLSADLAAWETTTIGTDFPA